MTFRLLVTDEIDPEGIELLQAVPDFRVDVLPTLPPAELLARIGDYDAILGRSATRISGDLLHAGRRLKVVGRAGVGVDNVAMDVATELGIAVINAPAGNTVAVAELVFGVAISLLRHIPRATQGMHAGLWERSHLMGRELKGRTLGIVGVGRIGGEVALRAQGFGMTLLGYDPYIAQERFDAFRVKRCDALDTLLAAADIVTVHTPLTDETTGMIGARELALTRPGTLVLNYARGGIVQEDALVEALREGRLGGAAVDAFLGEPLKGEHKFRGVPNLLMTPHLGASSEEAQRNVAVDCCAAVRDALLHQDLSRSLNVAGMPADLRGLPDALTVARRCAVVARALLAEAGHKAVDGLVLKCGDDLAPAREALLASAAAGALEGVVEQERLTLINARKIAASRGIALSALHEGVAPHSRAVEVRLRAGGEERRVGGVAPSDGAPRLTRIGAFHVDVAPRETLVVLTNHDVPGVIGRVGTLLGDAQVNIAEYHQARLAQGGEALAVIAVDGDPGEAVRQRLAALPDITSATVIRFSAR